MKNPVFELPDFPRLKKSNNFLVHKSSRVKAQELSKLMRKRMTDSIGLQRHPLLQFNHINSSRIEGKLPRIARLTNSGPSESQTVSPTSFVGSINFFPVYDHSESANSYDQSLSAWTTRARDSHFIKNSGTLSIESKKYVHRKQKILPDNPLMLCSKRLKPIRSPDIK